ncbi:DNA polymerase IV [hydrothermal vent metagenome]|uniref:DNA-directed DNA polymerase n=1 Tax=hydrothermal vent metagenome TaxID=652676 RepID=A0A3B0ZKY7_9ZZZZ
MIIHADMDAFYASVEIRERPELRNRPVAVGGSAEGRGVIAAASYAARKFGVRSAMPTSTALKRCPDLVLLPVHMSLYAEASRQIHAIFARYTPLIEPLSLDEAFLDVGASERLFGSAMVIARRIKQEVHEELGLVISMGVAPNKFLAKIASDLDKPDGFVEVAVDRVQAFLDPLPVSRLWGVGRVTGATLQKQGVHTIADLRRQPQAVLRRWFGEHGQQLWRLAHGIDKRPVVAEHEAKSISHETTFARDIADPETLRAVLLGLTEQVAWRLRRHGKCGRTVQLKLRFDDFRTVTRARSLRDATDATQVIWHTASRLLDRELAQGIPPLRLLGMGVSGFDEGTDSRQSDLFASVATEGEAVDRIADDINTRFGGKMLQRARSYHKGR